MFRVALRGAALAVVGAVTVSLMAAPSFAAPSPVAVTLTPTYGLVGSHVDITAASGLANVTKVAFGSGNPVTVAPTSDKDVPVDVPADATTGALTLTYSNSSTAPTDRSYTVQVPTSATISRSVSEVVFPHSAVISAVLTAAGTPVPGQPAHLQRSAIGATSWHQIGAVQKTTSQGRVQWKVAPRVSSAYRVVFTSVPAYLGTTTSSTRVSVRPFVSLVAPGIAPMLTPTQLHGRVRPIPARQSQVLLDRSVNGAWHQVGSARTDSRGRFTFSVSLPSTGRFVYRVRRPADGLRWKGQSAPARIRAVQRSLHSGMSGPDVTTLQQRLHRLHYDLGSVNGTYGFDTQHAVVAFEKIQGFSRDGVVGPKVWEALNHPRVPHLRHPSSAASAGVEVDLSHQVVLYAVKGRVERIMDASTGGGYYYTGSDGTSQRAITPTGHFSVVYQREGWVTSKLGTLYRPAYFNSSGYAIHGEGDVPSYPASHGCVRITVPARDRLGSMLYNGLSVWIY
jgi:N-acetylmuramoyl-L-alanine amidase